jgi:hypothetical protein
MRRLIVALIVGGLTILPAAQAGAIVYGQPDGDLHPNVGALIIEEQGQFFHICSGTLISPTVFLTAAHCTAFLPSIGITQVFVSFDSTIDQNSTLIPGTAVTNPNYNGYQGKGGRADPGDIAVVLLDQQVLDRTPAQLPTAGMLAQMKQDHQLKAQDFTPVGYGAVRETNRGGWRSIEDNDIRRYATQGFLSLEPSWIQLAMNLATGNGGTCYGDSGGPHFLGGSQSNLVVAITVSGDAVCKATDVDYRLDTSAARTFLQDYVTLP